MTLETRDSNELILVLAGYYRLLCMRELELERDEIRDENLLPYCSRHQVPCQGWNYPHNNDSDCLHFVNFGAHPPYQPPPPGENFKILITDLNFEPLRSALRPLNNTEKGSEYRTNRDLNNGLVCYLGHQISPLFRCVFRSCPE